MLFDVRIKIPHQISSDVFSPIFQSKMMLKIPMFDQDFQSKIKHKTSIRSYDQHFWLVVNLKHNLLTHHKFRLDAFELKF